MNNTVILAALQEKIRRLGTGSDACLSVGSMQVEIEKAHKESIRRVLSRHD